MSSGNLLEIIPAGPISFLTCGGCWLQVLEQLKRELRHKMEREISELQRRLWQDEDDVYFRELDSERVRRELRVARCQTRL